MYKISNPEADLHSTISRNLSVLYNRTSKSDRIDPAGLHERRTKYDMHIIMELGGTM